MEKTFFSFKGNRITNSSIEPILKEIKEVAKTEQLSKTVAHSLIPSFLLFPKSQTI